MSERPDDETKRYPSTTIERLVALAERVLEKQGIAVILVVVGIAWASGWLPFRLCDPVLSAQQAIEAMQADRQASIERAERRDVEQSDALKKIANAMAEMVRTTTRLDTRDGIRTCASIADKEARLACIQVALAGK